MKIGRCRHQVAGADEGQQFHVVRRKGRKTAEDAGYEKEFDRRREIGRLRKEYEEEADAKRPDSIGQNRTIREADRSVTSRQLGDAVAQGGTDAAAEGDEDNFSMRYSFYKCNEMDSIDGIAFYKIA